MAKKASKAAVEAVDVDASDKPGRLGIDEGIILTTFFLLVIAIAFVVVASKGYDPI